MLLLLLLLLLLVLLVVLVVLLTRFACIPLIIRPSGDSCCCCSSASYRIRHQISAHVSISAQVHRCAVCCFDAGVGWGWGTPGAVWAAHVAAV